MLNRNLLTCVGVSLVLLSGCLSSAPQAPTHWTIDFGRSDAAPVDKKDARDGVRLSTVDVRAPYAGQRLVVLRPDGSVAFDAFNSFAVNPAQLLKGAAHDAVAASGRFKHVFASNSSAQSPYAMEIVVTRLALDCRVAGNRTARAELTLTLLKGREAVAVVRGEGQAAAGEDYSAAFSKAFAQAMQEALGHLPSK